MSGWETPGVDVPDPVVLTVDGETFRAQAGAQQLGAWQVAWLSGPQPGYGFTTRRSDQLWELREELEKGIRSFLAEVDRSTGHLSE